jgi:hypothetical protein
VIALHLEKFFCYDVLKVNDKTLPIFSLKNKHPPKKGKENHKNK